MSSLSKTVGEFWKQRCKADLRVMANYYCDPGFYDPNLHDELCVTLQAEKPIDKLVVMARGHLKTTVAGTLYPLWLAVKDPEIRILVVSNSEPNAMKTVHDWKGNVESERFHQQWPELIPAFGNVRWSDSCAELRRKHKWPEGTIEAAGVGTAVIRRHFDVIIEDDTVYLKKDDMTGDEMMPGRDDIDKAIGFHKLTIPLLIDQESGKRVFIGTRWAEQDAIDYIKRMETADDIDRYYAVVDIPTIDPETQLPRYKRFSLSTLESIRRILGNWMYNMLYLNQPLSATQRYFRPSHTLYYDNDELPTDGMVVVTVDPADPPTGDPNQCYTAMMAAKHTSKGIFVLGYKWDRIRDTDIIRKALDMAKEYDATFIRVEADRYASLALNLRDEMDRRGEYYILEDVKTRGRSKEQRFRRLQPLHENGRLYLRKNMSQLEDQMYQYPNGRYNDLLDAFAWQVLDDTVLQHEKQEEQEATLPAGRVSFEHILESCARSRLTNSDRYPGGYIRRQALKRFTGGPGEGLENDDRYDIG